jgi:NTE family protein
MTLSFFAKSPPLTAPDMGKKARPKVGFVLGGGVARGWAHIGALQELSALGITPDIVAGASIGAVVGGCFA